MSNILVFLLIFLLNPSTVTAGGGRFNLYQATTNRFAVKETIITAQIYQAGTTSSPSAGERIEFRINNPQPGDRCVTPNERTDNTGVTYATCYANSERTMEVKAVSLDNGDESSIYLLHFINPPKPTIKPTSKPKPTLTPSPIIQPSITPSPMPPTPLIDSTITHQPAPAPQIRNGLIVWLQYWLNRLVLKK